MHNIRLAEHVFMVHGKALYRSNKASINAVIRVMCCEMCEVGLYTSELTKEHKKNHGRGKWNKGDGEFPKQCEGKDCGQWLFTAILEEAHNEGHLRKGIEAVIPPRTVVEADIARHESTKQDTTVTPAASEGKLFALQWPELPLPNRIRIFYRHSGLTTPNNNNKAEIARDFRVVFREILPGSLSYIVDEVLYIDVSSEWMPDLHQASVRVDFPADLRTKRVREDDEERRATDNTERFIRSAVAEGGMPCLVTYNFDSLTTNFERMQAWVQSLPSFLFMMRMVGYQIAQFTAGNLCGEDSFGHI